MILQTLPKQKATKYYRQVYHMKSFVPHESSTDKYMNIYKHWLSVDGGCVDAEWEDEHMDGWMTEWMGEKKKRKKMLNYSSNRGTNHSSQTMRSHKPVVFSF